MLPTLEPKKRPANLAMGAIGGSTSMLDVSPASQKIGVNPALPAAPVQPPAAEPIDLNMARLSEAERGKVGVVNTIGNQLGDIGAAITPWFGKTQTAGAKHQAAIDAEYASAGVPPVAQPVAAAPVAAAPVAAAPVAAAPVAAAPAQASLTPATDAAMARGNTYNADKAASGVPQISLDQAIAGRAGRIQSLRGAVDTAHGEYNDARNQGLVDAAAQRIPGMAAFALASAPRRAEPEARALQKVSGEYKKAVAAQAHDDKMGVDLGKLSVDKNANAIALANAAATESRFQRTQQASLDKENEDNAAKQLERANTVTDPKTGAQHYNKAREAKSIRMLASKGIKPGKATTAELEGAGHSADIADAIHDKNKNNIFSKSSNGAANNPDLITPLEFDGKTFKTAAGEISAKDLTPEQVLHMQRLMAKKAEADAEADLKKGKK